MRGLVPRFSHAAWSAPASRPDVVTFIRNAPELRTAYHDTLGDLALGLTGSVVAATLVVRFGRRA